MRNIISTTLFVFLFSFLSTLASAQTAPDTTQPDKSKKLMVVEAACGQCKFGLAGEGCNLAIRMEGKAYFVDGTTIDDHGDAHANDGFCNAIRKARVQGSVTNNRFQSSYFKLVPDKEAVKKEN